MLLLGSLFLKNNENYERVAVLGTDVVDTLLKELILLGKQYALKIVFLRWLEWWKKRTTEHGTKYGKCDFIPLLTAQIRLFGEKSLSTIYISAENSEEMESVMEDVEYTLLREHEIANADDADFTVLNQSDAIETMSEVTQIFTLLLGGIAGISLLVGGIGVMNIMLVSVTERTREIGIRKAIGAKEKKDILLQFLTESTFLSVAGGFLGILISFAMFLTIVVRSNFDIDASVTTNSILLAFLFPHRLAYFGALPAYKAGKLKPIDALRFE